MTADYTEADWSWDDHDTTVGEAPELSETERARLARIEAAEPAPESWFIRKIVAAELRAAADAYLFDDGPDARGMTVDDWLDDRTAALDPTS